MTSKKSKVHTLEVVEGNVLINIQPHKRAGWTAKEDDISRSFYVPKEYTVSHLKSFLNETILPSKYRQEMSYFLFAYGNILNNHERIGNIYEKYKNNISEK